MRVDDEVAELRASGGWRANVHDDGGMEEWTNAAAKLRSLRLAEGVAPQPTVGHSASVLSPLQPLTAAQPFS